MTEPEAGTRAATMKARVRLSLENRERMIAVCLVVLWLLFWEVFVRTGMLGIRSLDARSTPIAQFFAPPSAIPAAVFSLMPGAWRDVWVTVQRLAVGYLLGAIPALLLGIALGRYRWLRTSLPLLALLGLTPAVALMAVSIRVFGVGEVGKWVVVAISVFFPILYCTMTGVLATQTSSQASDESRRAMHWIFTGLKLAVGSAVLTVITAELYASTAGLGYLITVAGATLQTQRLWAGIAMLTMLSWVLWLCLEALEHVLSRPGGHVAES